MSRGGVKYGRKSRQKIGLSMDMLAEEMAYEQRIEQEVVAMRKNDTEPLDPKQAKAALARLLSKWKE